MSKSKFFEFLVIVQTEGECVKSRERTKYEDSNVLGGTGKTAHRKSGKLGIFLVSSLFFHLTVFKTPEKYCVRLHIMKKLGR